MTSYHLQAATSAQQGEIKALVQAVRINPLGLDWRRFVVALDENGAVVGCGQVKPHRDGSWELASIAVAPAWRGQGMARAIIEHLLSDSSRPLWLTCVSTLVPFYTRFGFREVTALAEMPRYFRWVSRLFRLLAYLSPANTLSVMRYDSAQDLTHHLYAARTNSWPVLLGAAFPSSSRPVERRRLRLYPPP
jgi:N-acetylglutamate synthase-like GNAT family acetyltransferase